MKGPAGDQRSEGDMVGSFGSLSDAELERRAAGGDRDAFGALYERHCDRVHDFLLRLLRDPQEAADLTQETFVRAMRALRPDRAADAAFTTWLFTIARNLALNRIARARRVEPLSSSEEDDEGYDRIDLTRLGDPEDAARANEVASLVWRAAAALEPRQRMILELHVRQGLDSAEIATVLGVTRGNAYTMLSRLKDAFEGAVAGLVMFQAGRRKCPELDRALAARGATEISPSVRKLIDRHVDGCGRCEGERRQLVSASALLRAFVVLAVPLALRRGMAEAAWQAIAVSSGAAVPDASRADGRDLFGGGDGSAEDGTKPWWKSRKLVLSGIIAALMLCALLTGVVIALGGSSRASSSAVLAAAVTPAATATDADPTAVAATPVPMSSAAPATPVAPLATEPPPDSPTPAPIPPTVPPRVAATLPPPPTPDARDIGPTLVPPSTGVDDSCATFWSRQPTSGAGPNVEYATLIVALQNRDRARRSIRPMIDSPQLASIAEDYARFLATTRWWETHAGSAVHIGADGRDGAGRMRDAGIIGQYANEQNIAPIGSTWLAALENLAWTPDPVGAGSSNPCEMHQHWSLYHVNNYLGIVDGVPHDNEYEGTSCYVIYASKTIACVQDFVVFP